MFLNDLSGFYESMAYGLLVLVLPVIAWTVILTSILVFISARFKVRVGITLVTLFVVSFSLAGSGPAAGKDIIVAAAARSARPTQEECRESDNRRKEERAGGLLATRRARSRRA